MTSTYEYGNGPTQSGKMGISRFIGEQRKALPVPDTPLDGKTVIVTGSNVGLGFEATRHIARLNAENLILAVRTVSKGEVAKESILKGLPNSKTNIVVYALDMSSFASVQAFAQKVTSDFPKIDIAILNAGINSMGWTVTSDGWETMVQVNVISTAYLALLLLPKIRKSYDAGATSLPPTLTIVASDVHYWSELKQKSHVNEPLGILNSLNNKAESGNQGRYADTKLMEVFFMRELVNWLAKNNWNDEVLVNCVNPGLCASDFLARESGLNGLMMGIFTTLSKPIQRSSEVGARNYLYAITAGENTHGQFIGSCEVQKPSVLVTSEEGAKIQKKVWQELGEVLVGVDPSLKTYYA